MTRDATKASPIDRARRDLLMGITTCAGIGTLLVLSSRARATDAGSSKLPLLKESDPAAQATQYILLPVWLDRCRLGHLLDLSQKPGRRRGLVQRLEQPVVALIYAAIPY